ncbi:hypothetical protein SAMN05216199_2309 [Pedococcus cremeus]|uniref:YdbS-like PH domain-containing protein n=1 Tax=Pedococcus cremeus TaxID=587636 RepID=A0A1H9V512_9MICO|nr:hypothetical protein SAMN05216199_2309 [Pedococcus cremeus]
MADTGAVTSEQGWEPVALYGGQGPQWRGVSPRLATARSIIVSAVCAALVLAAVALWGLLSSPWPLVAAVVVVGAWLWLLWLVRRQVAAISWSEQAEELVVRRGRLRRTLVSVPYGRLQLADMQSGPLARHFGLASVQIHTASPHSGGSIPGLPVAEAEALRARLTERGESQRAGL